MADAVVQFLVERLASLLEEEAEMLQGVRREADYMRAELERMTAFLRVADARENDDPQLKVWIRQVRDVAFDTEDVLDEFILRLAHHHDGRGFYGCLRRICCFVKKLKARRQIASHIRELKSRVSDIAEGHQRYSFAPQQGSSSTMTSRTPYDYRGVVLLQRDAEIVGFDNPKQQLVTWLVEDGSSGVQCISVVGMGGSGKTTLVKKVYDDQLVKKHFQSHLWLTISQSFTFTFAELLRDIIQQLYREIKKPAPPGVESMNDYILKEMIDEFLQQRRYLVVIDDVWSIPAWEFVKSALPDNDCCSRFMLTTRSAEVASASRIQTKDARDCHLQFWWLQVFHRSLPVELEVDQRFERLKRILSLSYYDLPYYLKICFLYMSLFPEDEEINNMRLIRLWVALGFVQERRGKTIEDVAEDYLYELINRSLVQVAFTCNYGKVISCRIHDLLREVIVLISKEQRIVSVTNGSTTELVRHLAVHDSVENIQVSDKYFSRLRSFLIFDESLSIGNLLQPILSSSKFLKVLDLRGATLDVIPDEIFGLLHLRYLNLSQTKVRIVPKLIENLEKLETLDLRGTYVTQVPNEIVKLVLLRNLMVGKNVFKDFGSLPFHTVKGFKAPSNIGALLSLQRLSTVEVDDQARDSGGINILSEIGRLVQLRKFAILKLRHADGMVLCSSISKLTNLRDLSLSSIGEEEVLDLEFLSTTPTLPSLKNFTFVGRLEKAPDWISSFQSLVYLCLWYCRLRDGNGLLGPVQGLPNLVELILDQAYDGEDLCFKAGGFQQLRALTLVNLQGLKRVRVEEGAMPLPNTLSINSCKCLDSLPFGVEHLAKLQQLYLVDMPNKLIDPLQKKDKEQGDYWRISHITEVWVENLKDGVWDGRYL